MSQDEATDGTEPTPWAMSIDDAARMVGMSKFQFRKVFLTSGRLRSIPSGVRDRIIDTEELRDAYQRFKQDVRAGVVSWH